MRELLDLAELPPEGPLYVYGSGRGGRALARTLRRMGRGPTAFLDTQSGKAMCDGLDVFGIEDFLKARPSGSHILVASDHVFEIGHTLHNLTVYEWWNANPVVAGLLNRPAPFAAIREQAWNLIVPRFAGIVHRMAQTGAGSTVCLERSCLAMPVHFYSPVPDLDDLRARGVWSRRSAMSGIDFREKEQLALLAALGARFGNECRWPDTPDGDARTFYTGNPHFSFGCAAATHAMIRRHRPHRVIEIGSGYSTRIIAAALRANRADGAPAAVYTVVDPHPPPHLGFLPEITTLNRSKVETLAPADFESLSDGDILFIDSGHTVRIGSDVNFLFLDVLPRLAPGVLVHIHDIPMPYEYDPIYATDPARRLFWTESYLLQALLIHTLRFRVLLAMNFLMRDHPAVFATAFPHHDPARHPGLSHSFWIECTDRSA